MSSHLTHQKIQPHSAKNSKKHTRLNPRVEDMLLLMKNPTKYIHETKTVKAGEEISFRMASGGGFIVHFTK